MTLLSEALRSRWFSTCLHAVLWLLLLAVIGNGLGVRVPLFREAVIIPAAVAPPVPMAQLERLFTPMNYLKSVVDPATLNLFTTSHFVPLPTSTPPTPLPRHRPRRRKSS